MAAFRSTERALPHDISHDAALGQRIADWEVLDDFSDEFQMVAQNGNEMIRVRPRASP
jgi:hypothetical protein